MPTPGRQYSRVVRYAGWYAPHGWSAASRLSARSSAVWLAWGSSQPSGAATPGYSVGVTITSGSGTAPCAIARASAHVASALPLLYGFAERIVSNVSPTPAREPVAKPASGKRRSRLHETVGYKSG